MISAPVRARTIREMGRFKDYNAMHPRAAKPLEEPIKEMETKEKGRHSKKIKKSMHPSRKPGK